MKTTAVIIMFLFLANISGYSQYRYPNKEDQALAKQLKSKYDEDDVLCGLRSVEEYSFKLKKSKGNEPPQVVAKMLKGNELIAMKDNLTWSFNEFYDEFSSLSGFHVWTMGNRKFKLNEWINDKTIDDYVYSSEGIFHDDTRYKSLKYSFDGLGDIMKYGFTKDYNSIKYFTKVFFNDSYPIEHREITFEIPDWLTVDLIEYNFEGFSITKTENYNPSYKVKKITYTMKDCSAIRQEDNAPIAVKNWPHIIVVVKQYSDKDKKYNAFNSVDDLYGWYSKLISDVKNNEAELKPLVNKLTEEKTSDIEKVKAIYYWVQDNIRYIAFESGIAGFQPENADKVYKNKYGDCKGMANLLYAMLKLSGFDARLTWIGTRDIPYDFSIPSLCVNNHMICALNLNDSLYFLDGTETYISLGDNAERIQGRPALIQDGKSYKIENVPSFPKEHNKVISKRSIQLVDESLKGTTEITYNGESKTGILRGYNEMRTNHREDALKRFLTGNDKNCSVSNIVSSDLQNREIPVSFKYNFELVNNITKADNEVYVMLELDQPYSGITIKEDRKQDFEFDEKVYNTCETEFSVPSGFKVKYLPESVTVKHNDFSFHSEYKQQGNKILYKRTITFDNGLVKKDSMKEFASFIKKVKNAYSDQLILAQQ